VALDQARLRFVEKARAVISLLGRCSSRSAEYNFVLQHLPSNDATILDVGCTDSLLALRIAEMGYKTYGVDFRRYSERHARLGFVRGDLLHLPFPDGFFDTAVAVSTIEHIGLGAYGDPIQESADHVAMREAWRVLKVGGSVLMTVPFAAKHRTATWKGTVERYYDSDTLRTLCRGFVVCTQRFFVARSRFDWIDGSEDDAKDPGLKWHANAALVLSKHISPDHSG